jgi:hypothetical protein
MKRSFLALGLAATLAASAGLYAAEPAAKPAGDGAEAKAAKWLAGLGKPGLVINQGFKDEGFKATYGPSAVGRITKFQLMQGPWWVSFVFKGDDITADTPVETLRKRFWIVALDRLPTPGLDLPGWEVRPQTPTSSFKEGVEILAYGDGRIKLQVKTSFFALYGRDPSILVPADAPSPPGSYFQIRRPFPLDLTIDAPVAFAK